MEGQQPMGSRLVSFSLGEGSTGMDSGIRIRSPGIWHLRFGGWGLGVFVRTC